MRTLSLSLWVIILCISYTESREDARNRVRHKKEAPIPSIGLLLKLTAYKHDEYKECEWMPHMCTATIISPIHILTAAHCVLDDPSDKIKYRFYPGLNSKVYGEPPPEDLVKREQWRKKMEKQACTKVFTSTGWISKTKDKFHNINRVQRAARFANMDHHIDYAVATLAEPIENAKLIIQIFPDEILTVNQVLETCGYPGDKWARYFMYYGPYKIDQLSKPESNKKAYNKIKADNLKEAMLITDKTYYGNGGQSGSPIFIPKKTETTGTFIKSTKVIQEEKLVAILVGGVDKTKEQQGATHAVRISGTVAKAICQMMEKDGTAYTKQPACSKAVQHIFHHYPIFDDNDMVNLVFNVMIIGFILIVIAGCFVGYFCKYVVDKCEIMQQSANSQK